MSFDEENLLNASHISDASPKAGDPLELTIKGVKAVFRYCPPGTFLMGSPKDEEDRWYDETQHEVTLTRGFWLLETSVTQALWKAAMGENPIDFPGDTLPMAQVSWYDCAEFISKLNAAGYAPKGWMFDFPTEAEWEYACRAGTTTPFNFGSSLNGDKANCNGGVPYGTTRGAYIEKTTPVKSYAPNGWGLYDMHGNVWDWCKDWYGEDYLDNSTTDPQGTPNGRYRVHRGGCWQSPAKSCRSANRDQVGPEEKSECIGFRLALRALD